MIIVKNHISQYMHKNMLYKITPQRYSAGLALAQQQQNKFNNIIFDLLPFYAILRSIPDKLIGVIAMFGSLLILLILPITDLKRVRFGGPFTKFIKILFFANLGILG